MNSNTAPNSMRIDKWLWAARFYKTRQLAAKALKNGRISRQQQTLKPASSIHLDDKLSIKIGPHVTTVIITGLREQRGSATVARTLYQETADSIAQRELLQQQLASQPKIQQPRSKPDKRGVRTNRALKRGDSWLDG